MILAISEIPQDPSKKHIKEADKHAKAWMKASAEFVRSRCELWRLLEDLYWNRRRLSEWSGWTELSQIELQSRFLVGLNESDSARPPWRADHTIPVAHYVDSYTQSALQAIFASDDYFTVEAEPEATNEPPPMEGPASGGGMMPPPVAENSVEDQSYPTAQKLQAFLISSCDALRFRTRTREFITRQAMLGTGVVKVVWLDEKEATISFNPTTGEYKEGHRVLTQGAGGKVVNLARWLPDPTASDNNPQLWSGVGDRSLQPYALVASRFTSEGGGAGPYNVNKDVFFDRWPEGGTDLKSVTVEEIGRESDAFTHAPEDFSVLQVWELHGKIHFSDRKIPTECVFTVVTDGTADDPEGGVLVRLQEAPALRVGLRPYLISHFIPAPGPFGMGLLEKHLPLIWKLSHAHNQLADVVRLCACPMITQAKHSEIYNQVQNAPNGDVIYPGKQWFYDDPSEKPEPMSLQVAHLPHLVQYIQILTDLLDRSTSVPNVTGGIGGGRKSATEAKEIFGAINRPIGAVLAELKENYLEPFGRLALAYFQRRVVGDQVVWVKGANGVPSPVTLTEDEIRTGQYRVVASLDIQDSLRISKAQTLLQLVPTALQVAQPMLQMEGKVFSFGRLLEEILRLSDIKKTSEFIHPVDPQTQAQLMGSPPGMEQPPQDPSMVPPGGQPPPDMSPEMMMQQLQQTAPPGVNGGPMGPYASDLNELFARLQADGIATGPVLPGMAVPT